MPSLFFAAWFLVIDTPGLGRGFIRDDFGWIATSTVSSPSEVIGLFRPADGFYRPVVALSFAADRALFGLAPLPYALTNLALLIMCTVAIFKLARGFGLPVGAAAVAGTVWLLNPHGINTTLFWVSGRTALLLTLFAVLGAVAFKRERPWLAALFTLFAMLSKEEAVALPFVFAAWAAIETRSWRGTLRRSLALFAVLLAYLLLRSGSAAMTPWTAPSYYRFTTSPTGIARNVLEYVDRSCTFFVVLLGIVAAVARTGWRRLPVPLPVLRQLLIWLVGLFGLTILLPLRSGLYVIAPSVAVALLAGAWFTQVLGTADQRAQRRVWAALCIVALGSVPIYWIRNAPNVRRGELTTLVLREVVPVVQTLPPGSVVLLRDQCDGPATLEEAFATAGTDAVKLFSGRHDIAVWLEPTPFDLRVAGVQPPDDASIQAVFDLRQGKLKHTR